MVLGRIAARKGRLVATAAAALCVALAPAGSAEAAQPSVRAVAAQGLPVTPLQTSGRFFRDRKGRVVILHGLFGVWKIPGVWAPPDSEEEPAGFTANDAQRVAALGLDAFRLAYMWEGLEPAQGAYQSSYAADIERVQGLLAERGVYSLIDSHQDMYSDVFEGDGFPAWAIHDDGVPLGKGLGFPANYFTPAVSLSFDNFWLDSEEVQERYAEQLAYMAHIFKSRRMVLGYDLINEPWPGSQYASCAQPAGCPAFDRELLQPAENRFAADVRAADPNHIVFYEPNFFFDAGVASSLTAPPSGVGQTGFSFHDECATRAVYQAAGSGTGEIDEAAENACPTTNDQVVANALATSSAMGATPLETEVAPANDSNYGGLECLLELDEQNMVGWTYGLSWRSGELRSLAPEKRAVLERAYPRAIAGTPTAFAYDPRNGHFSLTYATEPKAHGPTVIELPEGVYPHGYVLEVTGARATSAANASLLQLRNDRSSSTVTVQVRPSGEEISRPQFPACSEGVQQQLPVEAPTG